MTVMNHEIKIKKNQVRITAFGNYLAIKVWQIRGSDNEHSKNF